jgi:hypothetical protein
MFMRIIQFNEKKHKTKGFFTMNKKIIAIVILSFFINYGGMCSECVKLENLEKLNLSLVDTFTRGEKTEIAISMEFMGKEINKDIYSFDIEKNVVYSDPLSCCVAACRAIMENDSEWYSALVAPADMRNEEGVPIDSYTPDLSENMFNMYTYHFTNPNVPKPDTMKIKRYVRVGGMHAFQIEAHMTYPAGDTYPAGEMIGTDLRPIQCLNDGLFRFAPEWAHPNRIFFAIIADSELESKTMVQYKGSKSELCHKISINGLFGDTENLFPVKLFFLGGKVEDSKDFKNVQKRLNEMNAITVKTSGPDNRYTESEIKGKLSEIIDNDSLVRLMKQPGESYKHMTIDSNIAYIINAGKNINYVFYKTKTGTELNKKYIVLHPAEGDVKVGQLFYRSHLSRFLKDERVWEPLSREIEKDFHNN